VRVTVRVKPGSSRPGVGGSHDGLLVVAVRARAVDGKATEAALVALAAAFGVPRGQVRLVSGASARVKVIEVDADGDGCTSQLTELLAGLLAGGPGVVH